MGDFVRRNPFIVVGVSLPLALIVLILVVQALHRAGVAPPMTPLLYVYDARYFVRQHLEFEIEEGRLEIGYRQPENEPSANQLGGGDFTLAVYNPSTGALERHDIQLPAHDENAGDEQVRIPTPPTLARLHLDAAPVSPDGFRFQARSRRRGGLFGELFGFGGYGFRYELEREGVGFDVPGEGAYATGDPFIAWVVDS